ncbi:MAG: bifunctional folylpolyglutamate synthase/dihydrofolate synthase [Lachnospiraceae bacterium]|nr:bifunctional folylpolyglutamate synthase/dihydrofolate synthase [Lachnospiraceae bacterium]
MDFAMAMKYIEDKNKLGSVPGLDNVKELLLRLDNPQNKCKCLHIAGTNGKGSIFSFVEDILIAEGYKVGRYVSPTIFTYLERFQINKTIIEEEKFSQLLTRISEQIEAMEKDGLSSPTAFEIETALAYLYFSEEQVDYALIECGMGGKLDATNVIEKPVVSVMASVSMDHMDFLGNTIKKIAKQKAGIIKKNSMCISYPQDRATTRILIDKCSKQKTDIVFVNKNAIREISADENETVFEYKEKIYTIKLLGEHQILNAATAIEVVNHLDVPVKEESIRRGLSKTIWKGRMTRVNKKPPMYVDGAHNEQAWKILKNTVNKYFTNKNIIYIIGVLKDKEYTKMIDILGDTISYAITVTPDTPRGLKNTILAEVISKNDIPVVTAESSKEAIDLAMDKACGDDVILVCGSLSFISDYLNYEA